MIKYFKFFYNLLMNLKQYHAVHIWIIIPGLFWAITYILFWLSILFDRVTNIGVIWLGSVCLCVCYLAVIYYSFFLSMLIGISFFIYKLITQEDITVKSKFLLHNKFYNFIYLITLLNYLLLFLVDYCNFPRWLDFYIDKIYIFPWLYLLELYF